MPDTTPLQLARSRQWYEHRLAHPAQRGVRRMRVVIDTDAANEIDDAFAIAWALRCPDQLDVAGLYATAWSFAHRRADWMARFGAPADAAPFNPPDVGMRRSFDAIHAVLDHLDEPGTPPRAAAFRDKVFHGCAGYLGSLDQPLRADAVDHLIATAREHPPEGEPLYVVALGCLTNVTSALLLAPDLVDRVVVVWTSGFPSQAPWINHSFNLEQDMLASQWLLDSGVPHVYLPGYHVGAQLRFSLPDMQQHLAGAGRMGDWLHHLYTHNPLWPALGRERIDPGEVYSWTIWDIINIAWLLEPAWVPSDLVTTPRLGDDRRWVADPLRHPMREAHGVDRDAVFGAMVRALSPQRPARTP